MSFNTVSGKTKIKKLTPKQQKFVDNIVSGKNPSEALKEAYPTNMTPKQISIQTQKILKKPYIDLAIAERRKKQQEEINYTVRDNFNELDIGAKAAMSEGNLSAYIKAIELKGKLLGFYTEKKEVDVGLKAIQVIFDEKCKGL